MNRTLTCIRCPVGCTIEIEYDDEKIISVEGNQCKRGIEYSKKEVFNPERIVTTTARIHSKHFKRIPVKTSGAVPKDRTFRVVEQASQISVSAPVQSGAVLLSDVSGTGIDLIATQTITE
jgi:CxxC motif-containing protein